MNKNINQFNQLNSEEKVIRMFTVSSFGIYNCDKPAGYPTGVLCNAQLVNENKVKLMCYTIYLADKALNGLFTYYKNPITKFSFNPNSTNILWTVEDGVIFWLKPEQFNDIQGKEGMREIKMNRVEQKFSTIEELKTFFKL